jgi:hypothetical protein
MEKNRRGRNTKVLRRHEPVTTHTTPRRHADHVTAALNRRQHTVASLSSFHRGARAGAKAASAHAAALVTDGVNAMVCE